MNLHPLQSKPSANGFGRRRGDRDVGTKLENKFQPGKSNPNRLTNARALAGSKEESFESPSHDRLVYLTACFIGHHVEVQVKNGSIYSGIFHSTNAEKDFGIVLKMARLTKDTSSRGQKTIAESLNKAPSKILVIPAKDLVQVIAKDVTVTKDDLSNEVQHEKQHELLIDSFISQSRHIDVERELKPWIPDEDDPQFPELDNIFDGPWNRSWDQFEVNEKLFGVKSTFDEDLYTTKLERGPQSRELEKEASRIAREIEGEDTQDLHLAEERGIDLHDKFDIDEETRFSSVFRGKVADDSGLDESEDISFNSRNIDTFGGSSDSDIRFADTMSGKCSDLARESSSSSPDQALASQSSTGIDLSRSTPNNLATQLASESHSKSFSFLGINCRIQDNKQHGENDAEESLEKERQAAVDFQLAKCNDSQPLKKKGSDEGILPNAASHTCAPSKHNEKFNPPELFEDSESGKAREKIQSVNSCGRPGSSASLNSDGAHAASSSGPVLSPSSSVGSLSCEKSSLNPRAKEFRLNPNAKSFTPTPAPVRSPSPVSDCSFYYPSNMPVVPHIHGLPYGVGVSIGPTYAGHQPVVFNPLVAPQSPHAFVQPNGPQYAQPMLLGHPRQAMYMPGYQPEMPYKGREY